ncbi:Ankyrin-1 [Fusarium oxysporum f. sp. albedinis]|nr:Ankyrin-1 [Fusarium oxysporum f. sp. albedinis]
MCQNCLCSVRWSISCDSQLPPRRGGPDTSASEPVTDDDGIQRDVLNPPRVDFSGSKRVKQNSASREDVFAKPDKHKNAMRKHFCDAM